LKHPAFITTMPWTNTHPDYVLNKKLKKKLLGFLTTMPWTNTHPDYVLNEYLRPPPPLKRAKLNYGGAFAKKRLLINS
jgi:hypothetical protein